MGKNQDKLSDKVRRAIDSSGLSRYRICKECGIDQAAMSRFMHGKDITTATIDRLADLLGLDIVARRKGGQKAR